MRRYPGLFVSFPAMTIAPLDLILLLGSGQGFILAILLWTNRKGNRLSNRLLAVLIGLLALMSLAVGIPVVNRWMSLALDLLPLVIAMPLGPLIFFYTRSVLDPAFRLGPAERPHFYPVIIDLGSQLMGWVFVLGAIVGLFSPKDGPAWGDVMDEYEAYADIPRWISLTVYLVLTRRLLARQPSAAELSEAGRQRRRWLRQFVHAFLIFQAIWLAFMVPYIVPGLRAPLLDRLGWYPIYIPIAVLIYWLGLRGYLQSRVEVADPAGRKVVGTNLPAEAVASVVNGLTRAMETERLFLDPLLSVDKLGKHLQLSPKLISAVLNQHLLTNFNSYVNRYRIEAVKQRLSDPASDYLTLTGIALECGFNSQATFQRTFRQLTGLSPKEYLSQTGKTALKSGFE
ncbi:helix-turn-helix transcriptional regulator [Spirosoma sordidisoli]|nr:helix-turn-helix transcriptional regulator [Spirosoma sordidisoli]